MDKTPKIRVGVNPVSTLRKSARLIHVEAGLAHYRCQCGGTHIKSIENPFDPVGPSQIINCPA